MLQKSMTCVLKLQKQFKYHPIWGTNRMKVNKIIFYKYDRYKCSSRFIEFQHLLPVFLDNGFETLELFRQLDDQDLTTLGVTDVTDRAKILTAATLLPEEDDDEQYDMSSCK